VEAQLELSTDVRPVKRLQIDADLLRRQGPSSRSGSRDESCGNG
jgi:hypothetical protein